MCEKSENCVNGKNQARIVASYMCEKGFLVLYLSETL